MALKKDNKYYRVIKPNPYTGDISFQVFANENDRQNDDLFYTPKMKHYSVKINPNVEVEAGNLEDILKAQAYIQFKAWLETEEAEELGYNSSDWEDC